MGGIATFKRLDAPALDGVRQDHGRLPHVLGCRVEGGVDLAIVMATSRELLDLTVAHVLDHLAQAGVGTKEVLAVVGAVFH